MTEWNAARPTGPRDWALVERYLLADLDDRRRTRRWRWVRRSLYLLILFYLVYGVLAGKGDTNSFGPHTAVVEVNGEIASDSAANASDINDALDTAFKSTESKAVILSINSPGGSPVQADQVYREIMRLRAAYPKKPIYAVISDMGASGAYYIAAAATRIYVNPASLVGSIGVIMPGYGVPTLLQKYGIEDRTLTAGEHKNLLSPTRNVNPVERDHVQAVLDGVHRQFIDAVKKGRGSRLKSDPDLFSGYFWSGDQAIGLGLADAVGSVDTVARDVVKEETQVNYTNEPNPFESVMRKMGAHLGLGLRQSLGLLTPADGLR